MTSADNLTILDCTLRDGGYYNSWDFAPDLVAAYLRAIGDAGIDAVELGFRFTASDRFYGPYAYTTDDMISALDLPDGAIPGVMCNAKDLIVFDGGPARAVDALFAEADRSPVAMVRIAAHFREARDCEAALARLKEKGYTTGLNLMQATGRTEDEVAALAEAVSAWDSVDILYFADSLGNMDTDGVRGSIAALRKGWAGPIGVHMHDNMGRALANSLAAADAGVDWIDGTILGMGRGAGNVRTEYLLLEMRRRGIERFRPEALVALAGRDFAELQRRYRWGNNIYYYLSGIYGIHPTYVQQMLSDDRYEAADILSVLETLRDAGGESFSGESLANAFATNYRVSDGTWDATGWAAGRDVLLIAAGPGLRRHLHGVLRFIERAAPVVICLNHVESVPPQLVDAYAASHPTRILSHIEKFRALRRPVIMPLAALPDAIRGRLDGLDVRDYGMRVAANAFAPGANGCTVPAPLVAAYAVALARAAGARRVLLAGFDGYGPDDPRHAEMSHVFDLIQASAPDMPLVAVTPTAYTVGQGTVYAPQP